VAEDHADPGGQVALGRLRAISLGGKPAPVIDGLAGEQRFYLGFAQACREKAPADRIRLR
jgi:putative endopeptidase